jgi:phage gp46-like protein
MPDARLVNRTSLEGVWVDLLKTPTHMLDESEELANVVKVALMTDRLAGPDEDLPDLDDTDRRGWWGDHEATLIWNGWQIGCKNWLLARAKITGSEAAIGSTLVRAEEYTREALVPLMERRICSHIEVLAERVGIDRIDVIVTLYRGPRIEIELRFQHLWFES